MGHTMSYTESQTASVHLVPFRDFMSAMSSEFWLQCEWPAGHHAVLGRTGGIQDSDGEDMDTYLVLHT